MDSNHVLLIITTIAIFVNGYSIRRKNIIGILMSILFAEIPFLLDLITKGISQYGKELTSSSATSWTMAMTYIIFFWGMGYIIGGINIKKKGNTDELPGKTVEHMRFELDDIKR